VTPDQLTITEVAALAGIAPASVRRYRLRDTFPEPDGYVGRTPWWRRSTIEAWLVARRGPGHPKSR
jgi:predicted DNA-binding transcriptional regulator AlpA